MIEYPPPNISSHDVLEALLEEKRRELTEKMEEETDNIQHPSHYTQGNIECIDAIEAATGGGFLDYCTGNVIKYLWRWQHKNGIEDLKKAKWYLDKMIETIGDSNGR